MKVLVTGREGQLVQSLLERGAQRRDVIIVACGRPELDLERPNSILRVVKAVAPDVIINAAAYTAVDQAEDEPERAFRINAAAAGEIAAAACTVGARIIQISTDYVFDGSREEPYLEDAPTNPLGVYGRSKLAGEDQVRDENPEHAIVRTAWVYSPFGKNFVTTMMALARDRDVLTVVNDQRGNPSSALDLADGLLALLQSWRSDPTNGLGETYHLVGTGAATWFDFACHIFAESKRLGMASAEARPIKTEDWPTRAIRPANSVMNSSKFARHFAYRAPDWQSSVAEVVQRLAPA